MTNREVSLWQLTSKPLVFGNAEQIRAVRYLERFERDGEEQELRCPKCNGEGEVDCECDSCGDVHSKECSECDGEGTVHQEGLKIAMPDPRQLWLFPEMFAWASKPWSTLQ